MTSLPELNELTPLLSFGCQPLNKDPSIYTSFALSNHQAIMGCFSSKEADAGPEASAAKMGYTPGTTDPGQHGGAYVGGHHTYAGDGGGFGGDAGGGGGGGGC